MSSDEATKRESSAAPAAAGTQLSVIDEILQETKISPKDDAYGIAKDGVKALIGALLGPDHQGQRVDKQLADAMIAEIDQQLSGQLDEILHHPDFQKLESAWRGLKFAVDRTDFRENIKCELLNVSKEDLMTDFEDAP